FGKRATDYWDDRDAARQVMENDRKVMETGVPAVFEETVRLADGAHVFLSTKAPFRDENGAVVGIVGASVDITDRKRTEEALRRSQEHLSFTTEAAEIGTWEWDVLQGVGTWSPLHRRLWGYPPSNAPVTYADW